MLSDAMKEALSAAYSDALTGCGNRRALTQRGQALIAQSQRDKHPLSVVAIDIDHFKHINDRFGHGIGDAVLRHFATYCQNKLRPTDYFGRLGGEEFIAIMPTTPLKIALDVAEELRASMEALDVASTLTVSYHFSAGVVQLLPGESWDGVLQRADQALYQAKARGRNRVEPSPLA